MSDYTHKDGIVAIGLLSLKEWGAFLINSKRERKSGKNKVYP
jgi:hypothetical protein